MAKTNVKKGLTVFLGLMPAIWHTGINTSEEASRLKTEAAASSGTNVPAYQNVSKCKAIRDFIPTQVS
jgi:hypothetical protein